MITLTALIALIALIARGHHEELAIHIRAAVRNGLTRDEIKEVLLQSAIYCGVPDANTPSPKTGHEQHLRSACRCC